MMSLRPLPVSVLFVFKLRVFRLSIFTLSVLALSACQQAAWKAGATADDLKRDEQVCRAQAPDDDAAVKKCLRSKGWTVTEGAPASSVASDHGAPAANTLATKREPSDPLQQQSIQTWWKAGAQAADFDADANACLKQLGAQHAPNYAQHLYTSAMTSCLRARGWFAGHDPVYTPLR